MAVARNTYFSSFYSFVPGLPWEVPGLPLGGPRELRIRVEDGDIGNGRAELRVHVSDSGDGVRPELRDLVFEPFDIDRARGLELVFLGLPHEASMAKMGAAFAKKQA